MIDVIDEELNLIATDEKVLYRLKHPDNSEENVEINLFTPVVTPGTPINRHYSESIKNHLDLISRYWGLAGAEQGNYTNPNLSNDNRQGYTVTYSQSGFSFQSGKNAYDMFNTNNSSYIGTIHGENTSHYVQFNVTCPEKVKLTSLRMKVRYGFYGWNMTVKGSNDNSTWTTLVSNTSNHSSGSSPYTFSYTMTNSTVSYQYFQIKFTCASSDASTINVSLYYLQLNGYRVTANATENPLPDFIGAIEDGQRIYVKTDAGYVMYNDVDYNILLDGVLYPLPKTLSANTKYVLVYNGESFVTESNY